MSFRTQIQVFTGLVTERIAKREARPFVDCAELLSERGGWVR